MLTSFQTVTSEKQSRVPEGVTRRESRFFGKRPKSRELAGISVQETNAFIWKAMKRKRKTGRSFSPSKVPISVCLLLYTYKIFARHVDFDIATSGEPGSVVSEADVATQHCSSY